jgi:hypothetical protein
MRGSSPAHDEEEKPDSHDDQLGSRRHHSVAAGEAGEGKLQHDLAGAAGETEEALCRFDASGMTADFDQNP